MLGISVRIKIKCSRRLTLMHFALSISPLEISAAKRIILGIRKYNIPEKLNFNVVYVMIQGYFFTKCLEINSKKFVNETSWKIKVHQTQLVQWVRSVFRSVLGLFVWRSRWSMMAEVMWVRCGSLCHMISTVSHDVHSVT